MNHSYYSEPIIKKKKELPLGLLAEILLQDESEQLDYPTKLKSYQNHMKQKRTTIVSLKLNFLNL